MEFNRCSRCGNFYVSEGNVCPKCSQKDGFEFSTFKTYIEENGCNNSLDDISGEIGISVKNLNRFLGYEGFEDYKNQFGNINEKANTSKKSKLGNTGITFN